METVVTFFPMLILDAIACRGVLSVISLNGALSWIKIATPPCDRRFTCPSLNNPLLFFILKFVCFDSIVSCRG